MRKIKVILVLLICMLVFVLVAVLTRKITDEELKTNAYLEADMQARQFKALTSVLFLSTEWVMDSFLSAFVEYSVEPDSSSICRTLNSYKFNTLDVDDIYDRIESFMFYNNVIYSCVMTFVPGVIKGAPNGISASLCKDIPGRINLLDEKDIFNSDFYRKIATTGRAYIHDGSIKDSVQVWSIGVPIFDENKRLIGEFWIDVLEDTLSDRLLQYRFGEDAFAFIANEEECVVASTDKSANNMKIKELKGSINHPEEYSEWYDNVVKLMKEGGTNHFSIIYNGKSILTYVCKLVDSPYHLIIIKRESGITESVNKLLNNLLLISGIGLLLITIGLLYIFTVFKKQDDDNRQMESELNIASKIQRSILPAKLDIKDYPFNIFGFQKQAKSVGGDLYDYFVRDGKLHFCIGDVSGKGVPAALLMTELCSLYRYIAKQENKAEDIVRTLNATAMEHSDDRMICTLFVGILDLQNGLLDYCNAGHNPPVLIPSGDSKPEFMEIKANMPILAFENYNYKSGSLGLRHGDRLFLYTDGVTESYNSRQEFLGKNATIDILGRHRSEELPQLVDSVMGEIAGFMLKAEQNDDITILCIEYED